MRVVKEMKKNDDTIQKLFDDYAEDLSERSDLAARAKDALVAENAKNKKQQRKPKFWAWLAPICAALLIVVVSISVLVPFGDGNGSSDEEQKPQINYYSSSNVKGRSVALTQFDDTLNVTQLKEDEEYQIVYERYYAFYFANGELAYVKATLGVRSDEGFCEIVIIAEADGMVRSDLRNVYSFYLEGSEQAQMFTQLEDKGEYVTRAYFNARNAHFYVYAMTGANAQLAEKIISKIL